MTKLEEIIERALKATDNHDECSARARATARRAVREALELAKRQIAPCIACTAWEQLQALAATLEDKT